MFDIAKSHDAVVAVVASDATVADGMAQLIDFCADQESWQGWSALCKLDFAADEKRLKRWLQGVLTKEPPQKSINAFWFGLFHPIVEDKATCGLSHRNRHGRRSRQWNNQECGSMLAALLQL